MMAVTDGLRPFCCTVAEKSSLAIHRASDDFFISSSAAMLSLEQLKVIDVNDELSDEEILELRDKLDPILERILNRYFANLPKSTPCTDITKRLELGYGQKDDKQGHAGNGAARRTCIRKGTREKRKNEGMVSKRPKGPSPEE